MMTKKLEESIPWLTCAAGTTWGSVVAAFQALAGDTTNWTRTDHNESYDPYTQHVASTNPNPKLTDQTGITIPQDNNTGNYTATIGVGASFTLDFAEIDPGKSNGI